MVRKRTLWLAAPGLLAAAWRHHRRSVERLDMAPAMSPQLDGTVRNITVPWGRLSYRLRPGTSPRPPLVLVHGWGRTGDSAWWPLIEQTDRTVLALDLPGHGRSLLERRFTFRLAARAVIAATQHAGLDDAVLVGHSMGGAVCLNALRKAPLGLYSQFIAVATSAYWVKSRQRVKLAAAPWVLAPRSPILIGAQRRESSRRPDHAGHIAWEYAVRPPRATLVEAAVELRNFDATWWRAWDPPPMVWVVSTNDGVIDAKHQRRSAELLGARIVELPTDHSVIAEAAPALNQVIEAAHTNRAGPLLIAL